VAGVRAAPPSHRGQPATSKPDRRIIPGIGRLADGTGLAGAQDRHRNAPIGVQEDAMTTTADSTSTYRPTGREPECPAFPHLPADIQHALADFDARVADGRLPMAADGYPAIPAAAEAWVADFLRAHLPTEI
jgi:hypothetical protein